MHTEDFAQVTFTYAAQKYDKHNYEDIGRLLYRYGYAGQKDAVQMAIRLLANILLANSVRALTRMKWPCSAKTAAPDLRRVARVLVFIQKGPCWPGGLQQDYRPDQANQAQRQQLRGAAHVLGLFG
ncbi:hypothetical protein [Stutzerimonas nitrititolerans]|uniref:hypothetical protein n=1 Tax=Stutzerimonas nitrititolerans TaxID=2482751 RepID=UPI0035E3CDE4